MPIPSAERDQTPATARERIYQKMLGWILDGTLQAGERVFDTELADYFGTSRTPVREAIQRLADRGLMEVRPGSATLVAPVAEQDIAQLCRLSAVLNALCVEFAFPALDAGALERLAELNEQCRESRRRGTESEQAACDRRFHEAIVALAEQPLLADFMTTLEAHIARYRLAGLAGHTYDSHKEHRRILHALENRDLSAAMDAMMQNCRHP